MSKGSAKEMSKGNVAPTSRRHSVAAMGVGGEPSGSRAPSSSSKSSGSNDSVAQCKKPVDKRQRRHSVTVAPRGLSSNDAGERKTSTENDSDADKNVPNQSSRLARVTLDSSNSPSASRRTRQDASGRQRRHSVDVHASHPARGTPLPPGVTPSQINGSWDDSSNPFEADKFDKGSLPQGSSLFQTVIAELDPEEPATESEPVSQPTTTRSRRKSAPCGPQQGILSAKNSSSVRPRRVRFSEKLSIVI